MKITRLGCFSFTGILAAVAVLLIVGGVIAVQGGALFSPGRLNAQAGQSVGGVTSHAGLTNNCSACHTAPWVAERMSDRCMQCHVDVPRSEEHTSELQSPCR
jgi:hypothetical protein